MVDAGVLNGSALGVYYGDLAVRARIREYCGVDRGASLSCVFLSAAFPSTSPPTGWALEPRFPTAHLDDLLNGAADVFRSTWDRDSLLMCLDIDYLNAERVGHAYAQPGEVFAKIEPVYQAICMVLQRYRVNLLPVMTGRGYQFTGRIPLHSPVVDTLAALAPATPDWYETQATRIPVWIAERVAPHYASAYAGAGMVLEYLAHQVIREAAPASSVPVVVNGTNVGWGPGGREAVSLDLSAAGDPLDVRHLRVAFGGYQTHRLRPDMYGEDVSALDPLIAVPRGNTPLDEMLYERRSPEGARRLAASFSDASMPVVADGIACLAADYVHSPLARFHRGFYAVEPDGREVWHRTYDRFDLGALPPCVAAALATPNDLLLKPEHLQHVTRFLLSEGWAPRHVAGLVWSRYEKDHGWGDRWSVLSPRARAEFDVRVFAGMVATGLDQGVDFNCRSAQEKWLCPLSGCPRDLRVTRDRLRARRDLL